MGKRKNSNPKKLGKMLEKGESPEEILESDKNDYSVNQVVKKIKNPELKAKVAKKYLDQIIKENDVRNVLLQLPEGVVLSIVDKNSDVLLKNSKLGFALQAIPDNKTKIDRLSKYTGSLMDLEVRDVMRSLLPEEDPNVARDLERKKIQILANKMLENIKQFGTTMHLREMLSCLDDASGKDLLTVTLRTFKAKESRSYIGKDTKLRIVRDFKLIYPDLDINQYKKQGLLNAQEIDSVKDDIASVLYKKANQKAK